MPNLQTQAVAVVTAAQVFIISITVLVGHLVGWGQDTQFFVDGVVVAASGLAGAGIVWRSVWSARSVEQIVTAIATPGVTLTVEDSE